MALEEYQRKRHFEKTPEPSGGKAAGKPAKGAKAAPGHGKRGKLLFVIQKHAARAMHWDFRIEVDGVLVSWAIPKGPSFDPKEKRLAMHVEDHPVEYGTFEGVIPKGEYGGGTVMLWDVGTWEPFEGGPEDAAKHLADGHLKMVLHGKRLQGRWVVVRTRGYGGNRGESWLLIKEHDDAERPHAEFDAIAEWTTSAKTDRTMEEIAADTKSVWHSEPEKAAAAASGAAAQVAKAVTAAAKAPSARAKRGAQLVAPPAIEPSKVAGAKRGKLEHHPAVELATLVKEVPDGEQWLHEVKFDGYRILGRMEKGVVNLISRNDKDWTERFAQVSSALTKFGEHAVLFDGEVVVLKPDGAADFQALQNFARRGMQVELHYYIFDLLHLDGYDLSGCTLEDRKKLLHALFAEAMGDDQMDTVRYTDHIIGHGDTFYAHACDLELEGVVSKKRDSRYRIGRQKDWLKSKCLLRQEFVIVGYTDPGGSRQGFGALAIAVNDADGLKLVGRVGTGFSDASIRDIHARLKPLERKTPPVYNPPVGPGAEGVHWVEPQLVGEVAFAEWTEVGQLRHPSFAGLREDKPAKDVVAEKPAVGITPSSGEGTAAAGQVDPKDDPDAKASPDSFAGVKITNPDRVLWPDVPLTKIETMRYYESVADLMLPHVVERPLSLVRCPQGYTNYCFYQKHIEHFPKSVGTVDIYEPDEKGSVPYACVTTLAGVVGLVQMGVLEIHPWGSRADATEKPDRITFDLDPDADMPFTQIAATALLLHSELERLGLQSWLKTTGGKGLHVVVPISRRHTWDATREFARAFVDSIVAIEPRMFTANMSKSKREGKIFIDYLRNARGATAVCAYSTRARPGAPVSVPLGWGEAENLRDVPDFNVRNLHERIEARGFKDPWADIGSVSQTITKPLRKKVGLE